MTLRASVLIAVVVSGGAATFTYNAAGDCRAGHELKLIRPIERRGHFRILTLRLTNAQAINLTTLAPSCACLSVLDARRDGVGNVVIRCVLDRRKVGRLVRPGFVFEHPDATRHFVPLMDAVTRGEARD